MLQKLQVQNLSFVSIDLIQQGRCIGIVNLEPRTFPLNQKQIFDLLKIVKILNSSLMLLPIYHLITKIIILDNILETSIVSKQAQLYDMVAEFLPFHALVAIHIHLLEEVYQS